MLRSDLHVKDRFEDRIDKNHLDEYNTLDVWDKIVTDRVGEKNFFSFRTKKISLFYFFPRASFLFGQTPNRRAQGPLRIMCQNGRGRL